MQVIIATIVGMLTVFSIYWQLKCLRNDFAALAPSFLLPQTTGLQKVLESGKIIKNSKFISAVFFVARAHIWAPIYGAFALFESREDKLKRQEYHDLERFSFRYCERRKWTRLWFPSLIVLFVVTGVIINGGFKWLYNNEINFSLFLNIVVNSIIFIILFSIKNMFAPIITSLSFSYSIFQYTEKGVIDIMPVISKMLQLLFEVGEVQTAGWIYAITFGMYSVLSTGADIFKMDATN